MHSQICLRFSSATTALSVRQSAMRLAGEPAARFPHRFLLTVARTCVVDMVALVRRCRGAGVWPRSCPGSVPAAAAAPAGANCARPS